MSERNWTMQDWGTHIMGVPQRVMVAGGCAAMTAVRRNSSAWGGTGFRRTVCRPSFVLRREKPGRRRWWTRGIHALPGLGSPDAGFNVVSRACVEGVLGLHPMQKSRDAGVERRLKPGGGDAEDMYNGTAGPPADGDWGEELGWKSRGRACATELRGTCTTVEACTRDRDGFRADGLRSGGPRRGPLEKRWIVAAHKGQDQTHRR